MNDSNAVFRDRRHALGSNAFETWLFKRIFSSIGPAPLRVVVNGVEFVPPGVTPQFTVHVRDRKTLLDLMIDPEIGFGEAFAEGRIRVDGDLLSFLDVVYESMAGTKGPRWYSLLGSKWMEWLQANTPRGSRANIHRHYDLGNDFYRLWLDSQMVYTCAYFPTPSATLEQAQTAKLDYICRKLQLQRDETVIEAGCGWGALALHMARNYGVHVKAYNISHEQILFARRRADEEGLAGRVQFIEEDYRNITGNFDVFVSVGMLEHVGMPHYETIGDIIHRCVGDTGRGLLHFIGRSYQSHFSRWIRKRIFPGAYAPTLREAMHVLEPHSYSVVDVENLRMHYAKTIEHWLERFERSSLHIAAMYDPWFERAWRLYLAGSIAGFRTNTLQLFQVVFAGSKCRPLSWTRAPLYTTGQPAAELDKWTHAMS